MGYGTARLTHPYKAVNSFGNISLVGWLNPVTGAARTLEYLIASEKVIGATEYRLVCKATHPLI